MHLKEQIFLELATNIIRHFQPVKKIVISADTERPQTVFCFYVDTVALKEKSVVIEEQIEIVAHRIGIEVKVQIPLHFNDQIPESISEEKRFMTIAIYESSTQPSIRNLYEQTVYN